MISNYDKSEFEASTPVNDEDSKMEELWKTEHSLSEFTDPKNFKTYSELKKSWIVFWELQLELLKRMMFLLMVEQVILPHKIQRLQQLLRLILLKSIPISQN